MEASPEQFEILEIRAAGAYGVVCAAKRKHDPLGRVVGLKVLHGTLVNSPQVIMRTRDEARLLSKLQHPNIVAVEELLSFERRPVMVMEWVEGLSVRQVLDYHREGLPVAVVAEIVRRTARALSDAYNGTASLSGRPMHIIHRDINPSNLLLSVHGELKVVDFGVSRGEFVDRETTTISTILGAQGYMAPERMAGVPDGPAVDIYSLGVSFLEMLCGRLPVLPRILDGHQVVLHDHLERMRLPGVEEAAGARIAELAGQMVSFTPEERPTASEIVDALQSLQREAGLPSNLAEFGSSTVSKLYNDRPRIPPREHACWEDVSFLEDAQIESVVNRTTPSQATDPNSDDPAATADRRLRRFLGDEGWASRKRALKYMLALNPAWTPEPFLEVLDQAQARWWKFWVRAVAEEELVVAFQMLKHRPTPGVRQRATDFLDHGSKSVAEAAKAVVALFEHEDDDLR